MSSDLDSIIIRTEPTNALEVAMENIQYGIVEELKKAARIDPECMNKPLSTIMTFVVANIAINFINNFISKGSSPEFKLKTAESFIKNCKSIYMTGITGIMANEAKKSAVN